MKSNMKSYRKIGVVQIIFEKFSPWTKTNESHVKAEYENTQTAIKLTTGQRDKHG